MSFTIKTFTQLDSHLLYRILQLRAAVFIVEQTCYYQDIDGLDLHPETRHLLWQQEAQQEEQQASEIGAYARLLAPGVSYPEQASIGRVITSEAQRGTGLGQDLMRLAVAKCREYWPKADIKISAQAHLQRFYEGHGFKVVSEPYLEDGIPHVAMLNAHVQ